MLALAFATTYLDICGGGSGCVWVRPARMAAEDHLRGDGVWDRTISPRASTPPT